MSSTALVGQRPGGRDENYLFADSLLRDATIALERKRYEDAQNVLGRALALVPKHPGCLACLAICLATDQHKFVTAEKLARRAIRLAPRAMAGHEALGEVYYQASRLTEARRYFLQALALAPRDMRLRRRLAAVERACSQVIRVLPAKHPVNIVLARARAFLVRDRHLVLMSGMAVTVLVWLGLALYGQDVMRRETETARLAAQVQQVTTLAAMRNLQETSVGN